MTTRDPLLGWRTEFPILERTTYLVSNSLGAMPRTVPERLAEYARRWAEEGVRAWAHGWWEMPVSTGDEIAPLIGAGAGEVAMVPNVSQAQALILSALDFRGERDTIVMSALDFPSVRYVTAALAERFARASWSCQATMACRSTKSACWRRWTSARGSSRSRTCSFARPT